MTRAALPKIVLLAANFSDCHKAKHTFSTANILLLRLQTKMANLRFLCDLIPDSAEAVDDYTNTRRQKAAMAAANAARAGAQHAGDRATKNVEL